MAFIYREVHIPLMLIAVIIGYQIAIYFFQQYRKSKHEQLHLNKILLAFSLFFGCLMAGFVLRVLYNYYVSDPVIIDMLSKAAILVIMISTVGFMSAVCDPAFTAIVKPRFTMVLIVVNLIPIVAIFFLPYDETPYQLLLMTYTACLFYMLVFQLKLIKKTTGTIRTRLSVILTGEIMLGIAIAFGSEQIELAFGGYNQTTQAVWIVAICGAIVGLTVIFLGVFKFPAFLEFGWQDNLIQLLIIDNTDLKPIYTYAFNDVDAILNAGTEKEGKSGDREVRQDARADFASHGLVGIDDVIQAISEHRGKKIEKIAHGNVTILLQHQGDGVSPITYALLVSRDLKSIEYFLSSVKAQFEGFFKGIVNNLPAMKGEHAKLFGSFDMIVKSLIK